MEILGQSLSAINAEDILHLCEERTPESVTHDYKARYESVRGGEGRNRMLTSAAAFANTAGGIFVFGVTDDFRPLGIEISEDQLRRQLEQLLRSNIRPPLPGLRSREIYLPEGQRIVLVGVPRSPAAPHGVSETDGRFRFVRRAERQNMPMTIDEIRTAFLERREWLDRARVFHKDRMASLLQADHMGPAPGTCVVHAVPLGYQDARFDVVRRERRVFTNGIEGLTYQWVQNRPNLEGYLRVDSDGANQRAWIQEYRNGAVEMGITGDPLAMYERGGRSALDGRAIETAIVYFTRQVLGQASEVPLGGELAIFASIWLPEPTVLGLTNHRSPSTPIDVGTHTIPEAVLSMEETLDAVPTALRPLLDALWQTGAWTGSPHFDTEGCWGFPR